MTAKTELWRPNVGPRGSPEIVVNYLHDSGRMTLESVELKRYIEIWRSGLLQHQRAGKVKPEHLPTPEQVEEYLSWITSDPARAKTAPARTDRHLFGERILHSAVCRTNGDPDPCPDISHNLQEDIVTDESIENPADDEAEPKVEQRRSHRPVSKEIFLARIKAARESGVSNVSYLDSFPPIADTAKKLAGLSESGRKLIVLSSTKEWRGGLRARTAAELGIGVATLANRLKKALNEIGLARQLKSKKYLRRVVTYFNKHPELLVAATSPSLPQAAEAMLAEDTGQQHPDAAETSVLVPSAQGDPATPKRSPSLVVNPQTAGAFLVQAPPGAKKITITIDL